MTALNKIPEGRNTQPTVANGKSLRLCLASYAIPSIPSLHDDTESLNLSRANLGIPYADLKFHYF